MGAVVLEHSHRLRWFAVRTHSTVFSAYYTAFSGIRNEGRRHFREGFPGLGSPGPIAITYERPMHDQHPGCS